MSKSVKLAFTVTLTVAVVLFLVLPVLAQPPANGGGNGGGNRGGGNRGGGSHHARDCDIAGGNLGDRGDGGG